MISGSARRVIIFMTALVAVNTAGAWQCVKNGTPYECQRPKAGRWQWIIYPFGACGDNPPLDFNTWLDYGVTAKNVVADALHEFQLRAACWRAVYSNAPIQSGLIFRVDGDWAASLYQQDFFGGGDTGLDTKPVGEFRKNYIARFRHVNQVTQIQLDVNGGIHATVDITRAGDFAGATFVRRTDRCDRRQLQGQDTLQVPWNEATVDDVNYAVCYYPREPVCGAAVGTSGDSSLGTEKGQLANVEGLLLGNPITPTGVKRQEELDWQDGSGLLRLRRYYTSRPRQDNSKTSLATLGRVNSIWMWDYQQYLGFDGGVVTAVRPNGQQVSLDGVAGTAFESSGYRLSVAASGDYHLITPDGAFEAYDSGGRLKAVYSLGRGAVVVDYNGDGSIKSLRHSISGRQLDFSYSVASSGARDIVVSSGGVLVANYSLDSADAALVSVEYADGYKRKYKYSAARPISDVPLLEAVFDDAGTIAKFSFTSDGLAASTEGAGGAHKWLVSEVPGTSPGAYDVDVTPPGEGSRRLHYELVSGSLRLTRQEQPAGSGCFASASSLGYDDSNRVNRQDDFNGNRSCYNTLATRGLRTVEVEGLDASNPANVCSTLTATGATIPAGARKQTFEWHPTWPLLVRRSAPGEVAFFIYNGQPDPFSGGAVANCASGALMPNGEPMPLLCKKVVQATTDANGGLGLGAVVDANSPARASSNSYNADGQLVAAVDVLGGVTQYTYQSAASAGLSKGDITLVKGPLGAKTTYLSYDGAGRPAKWLDSNGTQFESVFDGRGRVTSVVEAGIETKYVYAAPGGALSKVVGPSGSSLSLTYDETRRITRVVDQEGNSVEYKLDAAGRITEISGGRSDGSLAKRLMQSYDALGRTSQVQGQSTELKPCHPL